MAKQQSLAAQAGTTAVELKMPSIFNQPQEKLKERFIAPYIVFAHSKRANEWQKIKAKYPNAEDGEMFLMEQDTVTRLPEVKLGYLKGAQYWAEADPAGKLLGASLTEKPKPFKEHIESVVLVYLADRLLPANMSARTTKCPAMKTMSDALIEAAKPEWADRGASYKETLALPQPFMRFFATVKLGDKQISKANGLPYKPSVATVEAVGINEIKLLQAFSVSETAQKVLDDAAERFQFRMAEIKQMAAKSAPVA